MAQQMTPEQAIAQLPKLFDRSFELMNELGKKSELAKMDWEQLGWVGGQRADHAAQLLATLQPAIRDLINFFSNCSTQIDGYVADPFGRKQGD